jgi:REP element-mobilizing transposase RayT
MILVMDIGASRLDTIRAHSVTHLVAHLVWSTKGRAPAIPPSMDRWLVELLASKAQELGCQVLVAGCSWTHVHVLVRYPPAASVSQIAHRLKGASSRAVNARMPGEQPFRWQDGFWAESVSPADEARLQAYIMRQREHHEGTASTC